MAPAVATSLGTAKAIAGMQAGSQVASGIAGSITSAIQNKKARKHAFKMAEYSYGKDLEQWERQNMYNSPTQQMARLKAAGLNPNMVYGTGVAAATGQAKESPKYQAPNMKYGIPTPDLNMAPAIQSYQDIRRTGEFIDTQRKQREAIDQGIIESNSRIISRDLSQASQKIKNMYLPKQLEQSIRYQDEKIATEKVRRTSYGLGNALKGTQITYQNLKNAYQQIINDLAADGIKLNEAWKIRALNEFIGGLGYGSITELAKAMGTNVQELIKNAVNAKETTKKWWTPEPDKGQGLWGDWKNKKPSGKKYQDKSGYKGAF